METTRRTWRWGWFLVGVSLAGGLGAVELTHTLVQGETSLRSYTFRGTPGAIEITERGAVGTCCFALEIKVALEGSRLTVREHDVSPPCLCPTINTWQVEMRVTEVPPGTYEVYLEGTAGEVVATALLDVPDEEGAVFTRGDTDANAIIQINDGILILAYLFRGEELRVCLDAADANDNGMVEVGDAIYLLRYLFAGGSAPTAPFPDQGIDPTEDSIGCSGVTELVAMDCIRGDVNQDGAITLPDAIYIYQMLFAGGPRAPCMDAADIDDDGRVTQRDAELIYSPIQLTIWPPPEPPPAVCGADLTPDRLGCRSCWSCP
jgi:hypothetical protein